MNPQTETQPADERRHHPHLRALYPDARIHIDHLFHNRHDWAGSPVDYLAQRAIHEAWPNLHGDDVRLLVGAIERMHQQIAEREVRS